MRNVPHLALQGVSTTFYTSFIIRRSLVLLYSLLAKQGAVHFLGASTLFYTSFIIRSPVLLRLYSHLAEQGAVHFSPLKWQLKIHLSSYQFGELLRWPGYENDLNTNLTNLSNAMECVKVGSIN